MGFWFLDPKLGEPLLKSTLALILISRGVFVHESGSLISPSKPHFSICLDLGWFLSPDLDAECFILNV